MVRRFALVLALLTAASAAHAVPRAFEATLTLSIPNVYTCLENPPPGEIACGWPLELSTTAAGIADIDLTPGGGLAQMAFPAGLLSINGDRYVSDNYGGGAGIYPIFYVSADGVANGAGSFGPGGGVMPLAGVFKYCLFGGPCSVAVANISVPLSAIGTDTTAVVTGIVNQTVIGAPWTTGTLTAGWPPTPVHGVSAPGHLELVTPVYVSTNIGSGVVDLVYARLTIDYVPEPATLALLGIGVAARAARGRARR
jgi:hypothetical protein